MADRCYIDGKVLIITRLILGLLVVVGGSTPCCSAYNDKDHMDQIKADQVYSRRTLMHSTAAPVAPANSAAASYIIHVDDNDHAGVVGRDDRVLSSMSSTDNENGKGIDENIEPNMSWGRVVVVESESDFGFFLPPAPQQIIGDHERDGIAFCTNPYSAFGVSSCQPFPPGFLRTAHFVHNSTANYVQVTGRLNGTIYTSSTDGGGQYDHNHSPENGECLGYPFFVNLIEPANGRFCIRCCHKKKDCPTGKSTEGCIAVLGGDYS